MPRKITAHQGPPAARAIDQAADLLAEEAETLRRKAAHMRQIDGVETDLAARLESIRELYLKHGLDAAAAALGERPENLKSMAQYIDADERQKRKQNRDMEIMALARRGFTNAQLAKRFGLAKGTVSGIVQKGLRHWPANLRGGTL